MMGILEVSRGRGKAKPEYAVKDFAQVKICPGAEVRTDGFPPIGYWPERVTSMRKPSPMEVRRIVSLSLDSCGDSEYKWFHIGYASWVGSQQWGRYVGEFCYCLDHRCHQADLFEHLVSVWLAIGPFTPATVVRMS